MFSGIKIFNKGVLIVFLLLLFGFVYSFGKSYTPKTPSLPLKPPTLDNQQISIKSNQTAQPKDSNVLGKRTPYISVSGGRQGYSAGGVIALPSTDEPAVQISGYDVSGPVEVSIYETNDDAVLNYLTHNKDGKQTQKKPDVNKLKFVAKLNHNITSNYGSGDKLLLPLKETGIWLLRIKYQSFSEDSFVIRSNIGAIVKEGDDEYIFWGQNFKTKRSVVNEGVVILYNLQDTRRELERAPFNSDGIAKAKLNPDADIALVAQNADRAIIPINLRYLNYSYDYKSFQAKVKQNKYFVFTDRPLYRPGDTIYFKSIIRDDDDARYTIPKGLATVKIYDGWGEENLIFEKKYEITEDGTVYGEYKMKDTAKTGYYNIAVSTPENTTGTSNFNVEFFRKPEYFIEVSTPKTEFISRDTASFTISGSYFSGQPLSNRKVKYRVYASDFYEYDYLMDRSYILNNDYRYSYWWGSTVQESEATLNQNGEAEINLNTELSPDKKKSQIYSIEAELDDGSGNPSYSRKNILVYAGEYGIYRKDYSYYNTRVGEELKLPVTLVSYRNTSANGIKLKAKVHRENWIEYQDENQKYPSYKKEDEYLPDISAKTDSGGNAVFSFTPQKAGSYLFTVEGEDTRGNKISKNFYSYVSFADAPLYTGGQDNELTIRANKQKFNPGESVEFTITSTIPKRDVFLSMERGRVNRYQIVHLNDKVAKIDVPLIDTDIPNIFAKVSGFSDSFLDNGQVNVIVSTDTKKLVVNVTPNRKTFGPSDEVTINVETKDIAGNPVSANVGLWAIDKAIFELMYEDKKDIFETFWSERYNETQEAHSLEGITALNVERGGGCFAAGTQVLMSNGKTKSIEEVKIGDYVLTFESEKSSKLIKAKVIGTHKNTVSGYFIINGTLHVTSNHRLWVNNSWKEVNSVQIGDILTDRNKQEVRIESIEWVSGKFDVYNLSIEKYKTYFAGGVWVHNQKGGGTRTIFKDTAYWNPSIKTDTNGRAQVTFKLPDNLTTWVVSAVGSTTDTKLGQIRSEIVVTKDIIVRPILPNILRSGDKIVLSALVQNFTENDETFDISLKFDSGDVEKAALTGVLIKSKEMQQVFFTVYPKQDKEKAKLTFSAKSTSNQKLSDTIVQEIPVRPFGFMEQRAEIGNGPKDFSVKLSSDINKQKSNVTLSLAPTILGTLPSAMDYLIAYPYGCVEQTTSRFVPSVIAKANSDLFKDAMSGKDVDDMIKKGLSRLSTLQRGDGGWTWWYSGKSDYFITAYVVEYVLMARDLGIEVDKDMLNRAQGFLERQDVGTKKEDMIAKTYALTLLNSKNRKTKINDFNNLTPDILAIAVMANYKNGDTNAQTNGLSLLESMAKTQGDGVFWTAGNKENFASNDASTAFAIRAIITAGGNRDLAVKGARYLTRNRSNRYWSNTFATAQVIRSIVDLVKTESEINPNYNYSVKLDGLEIAKGSITDSKQTRDIKIPLDNIKPDGSKISVIKNGEGQIYSTLVINEFHTDRNAKAKNNGLTVRREYVNDKGPGYSLAVGDTITVKITVGGLNSSEYYGVIEDQLPSGIIPINKSFKNEQYGDTNNNYYYGVSDREITENGIVMSLYQIQSGENTYTYSARVISEGTFIVPPATAGLMYSPEINGRSDIQTIKTTKQSEESIVKESQKEPSDIKIKDTKVKINPLTLGILVLILIILVIIVKFRSIIIHIKDRFSSKPDNTNPPPQNDQQNN